MRKRKLRLWAGVVALAFVCTLLSPAGATAGATDAPPSPLALAAQPGSEHTKISVAKAEPTGNSVAPVRPAALPPTFWVLQMNLCNSGYAGCYADGQAIPEAQDMMASTYPDLVTLNEICLDDVGQGSPLFSTMIDLWPGNWIFSVFMPAYNSSATPAPVTCTNGQQYGNAIIGRVPEADWNGIETAGALYPEGLWQNPGEERRSWACVYAIGNYHGCVTHLDADSEGYAMNQCEYLMDGVLPAWWDYAGGYRPTVVGGDFNLKYGSFPPGQINIQNCVPDGWFRKGDGDVQHIMATDDFTFNFSLETDLEHTDHPAWLVVLNSP